MPSATRSSSSASAPTAAGSFRPRTPMRGQPCYHFWRVGTWEPGPRIDQERNGNAGHPPAFTADGRLMALGIAPDQVLLADAATGRELARLTTLQPVTPTPLVFSPDGTKLVAAPTKRPCWCGTCGGSVTSSPRWGWTGTLRRIRRRASLRDNDARGGWGRSPRQRAEPPGRGLGLGARRHKGRLDPSHPDAGARKLRDKTVSDPAGTGRRRSDRAPGAARRRTGRDEPPARRQA